MSTQTNRLAAAAWLGDRCLGVQQPWTSVALSLTAKKKLKGYKCGFF